MIYLKTDGEIEKMRVAGRILARVHELVAQAVRPGITTKELNRIAEEEILRVGAKPSFKGLYGYPATINASINEEVIHGLPSGRKLRAGDVFSVDIGVYYDGFHSDAARTYAVGSKVSKQAKELIAATRQSFFEALKYCKVGYRVSDISHAVQAYCEARGLGVVRGFTGHGVGKSLHEDPQVPNYGEPGRGARLVKGMVIAIEPMITAGGYDTKFMPDGWTVVTVDGSLAAHYENTVVITDGEPEILTLTSDELAGGSCGD